MSKRRWLVEGLFAALVVGLMAHLLVAFSPQASAEDNPEDVPDDSASNQDPHPHPDDLELREFFTLYPAGEGDEVQSYEELSQSEKGYLDRAGEWAETGNGHAVHSRWSGVSREKRRIAKAKRAQKISGTQGLGELGVD